MIEDRKRKLIDALIEICRSFLHTTNNTSEEAIHEAVEFNSKNPFFRELVQEDLERAELEIQDLEGIDMDIGASLNAIDDQFEEWLTTDRKQKLDHHLVQVLGFQPYMIIIMLTVIRLLVVVA